MFEIIPGILEKDFSEIEKKIEQVRNLTKIIHIDFIDGKFTDNTTFLDFEPFKKYTKDFFFEAHLMVDEPIKYLDKLSKAGFKRFIGHIEKMSDQSEFVEKGEFLGEVALALDAQSSLEKLKVDYEDLDSILVMSVKAGHSGQSFITEVLEKVKKIKEIYPIIIEMDGGINSSTIIQAKEAGAQRFVVTSSLFKDDLEKSYRELKDALGVAI
jgi:ribulose-phosphate 3-epimerase